MRMGCGRLAIGVALCLTVLSFSAQPADAAQGAVRHLSLPQAIALALKSNRTLQAARLEQRAAEAEIGVARGAMLPRLDAIENYSATDNPVLAFSNLLLQQEFTQANFALSSLNHPGTLSNFQSQIQLSFPVYAGGSLLAGFKAAELGAQAERWRAAGTRNQVAFAVIRAYYGALLAEEGVGVVGRALAAARSHLIQTRNLFDQGMVVKADVLRTEVLAGSLQEQLTDATNQLQISRATLAHVLGDESERLAPLPLPAAASTAPLSPGETLAHLTEAATRARPELKIAAANVSQAQQAVTIARAGYLPRVNVATTYEADSEKLARAGNNFAVFAYARINLFNGLATRSRVDEALARFERARTMAEDLKHAIALEVETAYRSLDAARQNLGVARRNYAYASDALRILEDRYGQGLATNVAVLDAQSSRQQADMELVRARVSVMVDAGALDLAVGRMPGGATER